jgi:hypothetical protein
MKVPDKKNLTYTLPRISFNFGPYAQRFSLSELNFFVSNLRKKSVISSSEDTSVTKRLLYHKLNDGTAILTNTDGGKSFGIHLQLSEIDSLLMVDKIFRFMLEKQKASDEELKDIILGTLIDVIYEDVLKEIKNQCIQCQSNLPIDGNHFCQNLTSKIKLVENIVANTLLLPNIKNEFSERFEFICNNWFVDFQTRDLLEGYLSGMSSITNEIAQQLLLFKEFDTGKAKNVERFWTQLKTMPENFKI